jgi:hypothetical protein
MVPVQYRNSETGEVVGLAVEEAIPADGERRSFAGVGDCEVLCLWSGAPTSCVVYVRPVGPASGGGAR